METVGAAVVAECANQYGDLQDEVGLVTDHILFSVYLFHSVCVCVIFCMKGVLMILRLVETWLRAGPPHTPQVCIG